MQKVNLMNINAVPKLDMDWEKLSKFYEECMEDMLENVKDELYVAKSVFEDIEDFINERENEYDLGRILKYVSDRIDGLTEMCPILYSLSHDSAKENAEAD